MRLAFFRAFFVFLIVSPTLSAKLDFSESQAPSLNCPDLIVEMNAIEASNKYREQLIAGDQEAALTTLKTILQTPHSPFNSKIAQNLLWSYAYVQLRHGPLSAALEKHLEKPLFNAYIVLGTLQRQAVPSDHLGDLAPEISARKGMIFSHAAAKEIYYSIEPTSPDYEWYDLPAIPISGMPMTRAYLNESYLAYCERHPHVAEVTGQLPMPRSLEEDLQRGPLPDPGTIRLQRFLTLVYYLISDASSTPWSTEERRFATQWKKEILILARKRPAYANNWPEKALAIDDLPEDILLRLKQITPLVAQYRPDEVEVALNQLSALYPGAHAFRGMAQEGTLVDLALHSQYPQLAERLWSYSADGIGEALLTDGADPSTLSPLVNILERYPASAEFTFLSGMSLKDWLVSQDNMEALILLKQRRPDLFNNIQDTPGG